MDFNTIQRLLNEKNQSHLMQYYNELSPENKIYLLKQINDIEWNMINLSCVEDIPKRGFIEPLGAMEINEINTRKVEFESLGLRELEKGKLGAVLLAGGQGTRLGFDKPKGMLNVGVHKDLYLFEILISNLLKVVNRIHTFVPLYIMTSSKNYKETTLFFQEHNYFGYDKSYLHFFIQEMTPSVDLDGRLMLEDKGKLSLSPNGNGGWFSSMSKAGLLENVKERGIEWLNVFSVDNVMQYIADPSFLGAILLSGCDSGAKVVAKANPLERVGVLCLEDGKPSIVEYFDMTEEMINLKDGTGKLLYNYGVILNYIFSVDSLSKTLKENLPVHVVKKAIPYINNNGQYIDSKEPNGYKFETLVLDMIKNMNSCLAYEVIREQEFAPIKNSTGIDSLETARNIMVLNGLSI